MYLGSRIRTVRGDTWLVNVSEAIWDETRGKWLNEILDSGTGGGGGLTPDQEAKLNAITLTGDGNSYLANDGTYKAINLSGYVTTTTSQSINGQKTFLQSIRTGGIQGINPNLLCGTSSQPWGQVHTDQLYLNGVLFDPSSIDLTNVISYDSNNNIILRNGTKIAGAPLAGGTNHEIFGINTYIDGNGSFDVLEVGSQETLFTINLIDNNRTNGRILVDIYSGGTRLSQQRVAYEQDLEINIVNIIGANVIAGQNTIPIDANSRILSVTYNRFMLISSDYTYQSESGLITITNSNIISDLESDDVFEVKYLRTELY